MVEWERLYGDLLVLKDDLLLRGVNGMEDYFVAHFATEHADLCEKELLKFLRCVDVQRVLAVEEVERRDESDESEAVVAMDMGDEDR